jgi:ubiquinone/menaquinone biosynthesis C-methylase UbiE
MNFDILAPHYRWMECVLAGGKLQRCRTQFLDKISPPKHALLVGEGHGRFIVEFLKRFPQTHVVCHDASEKMLAEAKRAIEAAGLKSNTVTFARADVFDWQPPSRKFELIVTNFFLDCFTPAQIEVVVQKLASAAEEKCDWLLADFCEPASGWRKWRAHCILASMYLFFRFATKLPATHLAPPDDAVQKNGFVLANRVSYDWGLLHADVWRRRSSQSRT